ncbi:MAG: accessory gene regulator B family protein [Firmicutes bacterium]|nr:accessory gene regulator B family protein [Bacillota bacterium]
MNRELSDWCTYWLQKRILTMLIVLLMSLLGEWAFGADVTVCFLLGLLPLRRRLCGYHTKSPGSCMVLSLGVMLLALLVHSTFNRMASIVFSIVSFSACFFIVICVLIDQTDPQLHLTQEEIKKNHQLAVCVLIGESVVSVLLSLLLHSVKYVSACQMGIVVVVLSSSYNKLKLNRRCLGYGKVF